MSLRESLRAYFEITLLYQPTHNWSGVSCLVQRFEFWWANEEQMASKLEH